MRMTSFRDCHAGVKGRACAQLKLQSTSAHLNWLTSATNHNKPSQEKQRLQHTTATTMAEQRKRLSPDNIVCVDLTTSPDDEETVHLKSVRKRLKSGEITPGEPYCKKVKSEFLTQAKDPLIAYDDVELVEKKNAELIMCLTVSCSGASHDDIAVVGTLFAPHASTLHGKSPFRTNLDIAWLHAKS
jgi:hypothetical protein